MVQQLVRELNCSQKCVLAGKTPPQELLCSLLQTQLGERIKPSGNLRDNIPKISLAKELSERCVELQAE